MNNQKPRIFPTIQGETKIFLLMSLMIFLASLSYSLLDPLKNEFLMMNDGFKNIAYIKTISLFPISIFAIFYVKYLTSSNMIRSYYYLITIIASFFILHAFILAPNIDFIQPSKETIDDLVLNNKHFAGFIKLWGCWVFALCYFFQSLWQVIFYSIIFWQLANFISTINQSKRHYPFYALFGGFGALLGSLVTIYNISNLDVSNFHYVLKIASVAFCLIGIAIMLLIYNISALLKAKNSFQNFEDDFKNEQYGFINTIKAVACSKYMWLIVGINFCFGYSSHTCSLIWYSEFSKIVYSSHLERIEYYGLQSWYTGIVSIISLIIIILFLRRVTWRNFALSVPIISIILGLVFLISSYKGLGLENVVFLGSIFFILSKSYLSSAHKLSRELAYIPLKSFTLKGRGRVLIETLVLSASKSLHSLFMVLIFTIYPEYTIKDTLPILLFIFVIISLLWIYWTISLGKEFKKLAPSE